MHPVSLHGNILAASEVWSELLTTLLIMLFIAVPAILRTIAEAQNRQKERQRLGQQKLKDVSQQKIGPHGLGTAEKGTQRPRGPLSEWDRRQQQIRERMNKLKEQAELRVRTHPGHRRQMPAKTRVETVPEEVLPVAQALPEQPERVSRPPVPPVRRPAAEQPTLQEKMRRYMQQTAASTVARQKAHTPKPQAKPKRTTVLKHETPEVSPAIERIVRSSNPLRAGIILKEILDKPKALRFGSDI